MMITNGEKRREHVGNGNRCPEGVPGGGSFYVDAVRALGVQGRDYLVTVYSVCRRASCWHAEFMCERSRDAGTVDVRASVLRAENREHPDNFSTSKLQEVCGPVRYVS